LRIPCWPVAFFLMFWLWHWLRAKTWRESFNLKLGWYFDCDFLGGQKSHVEVIATCCCWSRFGDLALRCDDGDTGYGIRLCNGFTQLVVRISLKGQIQTSISFKFRQTNKQAANNTTCKSNRKIETAKSNI
jgi:hypothetical protein